MQFFFRSQALQSWQVSEDLKPWNDCMYEILTDNSLILCNYTLLAVCCLFFFFNSNFQTIFESPFLVQWIHLIHYVLKYLCEKLNFFILNSQIFTTRVSRPSFSALLSSSLSSFSPILFSSTEFYEPTFVIATKAMKTLFHWAVTILWGYGQKTIR